MEDIFKIYVNITSVTTTDPEIIEVEYHSLFETNPYIRNVVRIEVSGRSMNEPVQVVTLNPIIDEVFPDSRWERNTFSVRAVLPERTFLEKIFLLHEEFSKYADNIRVERMSRHMYDIGQIDVMANLFLAAGGRGVVSTGGGGSNGELTNWDGTKKRNGWGR